MFKEALTEKGAALFAKLKSFGGFYLAGGSAIALQLGHKISIDFDLFYEEEIKRELLAEVKRIFPDSRIQPLVNNPDELSVLVDGIKITFLKYPFPVLEKFVDFEGIKLLGIAELAATKAYTIGRRGSLKDYVDLYFILSGEHADLNKIIGLAEKKYGSEFNSRLFLEQLIYLEDVEEVDILFLKEKVGKGELERFFREEVGKIKL